MTLILYAMFGVLLYIAKTLIAIEKHQKSVAEMNAERQVKILKEIELIRYRLEQQNLKNY